MKILIKNAHIITMNPNNDEIINGYIIIEDDLITAMVSGNPTAGYYNKEIDVAGNIVMPGFINTHTHAAMTLLRGYADDLALMKWLNEKIWPVEAKLTPEDIYWGTKLAITEMIKSGTTCFADMYFFMDKTAQAVAETGIRAVLARGLVGVGPEAESGLLESEQLFNDYNDMAQGRIKVWLGPHAPYTCPPDYLRKVISLAHKLSTGIHIHLSETKNEIEDIKSKYGTSPIVLMESLGLFDLPVLAAHGVHLDDNDISILKTHDVAVAHNPQSNMKLASGVAPVVKLLHNGNVVSLGTDGAASNNNLDMLEEMRTAALLQKVVAEDPQVLPASQALRLATVNGAQALHWGHALGQLSIGYKADMIIVSAKNPHMIPTYNHVANMVYSAQASDVLTVIVNGQVLMEDREIKTFSEEEVLVRTANIAERLKRL